MILNWRRKIFDWRLHMILIVFWLCTMPGKSMKWQHFWKIFASVVFYSRILYIIVSEQITLRQICGWRWKKKYKTKYRFFYWNNSNCLRALVDICGTQFADNCISLNIIDLYLLPKGTSSRSFLTFASVLSVVDTPSVCLFWQDCLPHWNPSSFEYIIWYWRFSQCIHQILV